MFREEIICEENKQNNKISIFNAYLHHNLCERKMSITIYQIK